MLGCEDKSNIKHFDNDHEAKSGCIIMIKIIDLQGHIMTMVYIINIIITIIITIIHTQL